MGIVASRLSEKLCMPCFMICLDRGMGKGSCRSYGGVNLFQALSDCAPLLEGFGGHALAAGFTVREENIPALAQSLRRAVAGQLKGTVPLSVLRADAAVTSDLLTVENIQALDLLEPCGTGNPRPVLVVKGALVQSMNQVGRGRHLKLRLESRGVPLDAIFFSADGGQLHLTPGCRVDVAFYPQINEFRGQRSAQLQVLDLRTAPSRAQQERLAVEKYFRGEELSPEAPADGFRGPVAVAGAAVRPLRRHSGQPRAHRPGGGQDLRPAGDARPHLHLPEGDGGARPDRPGRRGTAVHHPAPGGA